MISYASFTRCGSTKQEGAQIGTQRVRGDESGRLAGGWGPGTETAGRQLDKLHSHETCPLPAVLFLSTTSFHLLESAPSSHTPEKPTLLAFVFAGLDVASVSGDCGSSGELMLSLVVLDVGDSSERIRGEVDLVLFAGDLAFFFFFFFVFTTGESASPSGAPFISLHRSPIFSPSSSMPHLSSGLDTTASERQRRGATSTTRTSCLGSSSSGRASGLKGRIGTVSTSSVSIAGGRCRETIGLGCRRKDVGLLAGSIASGLGRANPAPRAAHIANAHGTVSSACNRTHAHCVREGAQPSANAETKRTPARSGETAPFAAATGRAFARAPRSPAPSRVLLVLCAGDSAGSTDGCPCGGPRAAALRKRRGAAAKIRQPGASPRAFLASAVRALARRACPRAAPGLRLPAVGPPLLAAGRCRLLGRGARPARRRCRRRRGQPAEQRHVARGSQ